MADLYPFVFIISLISSFLEVSLAETCYFTDGDYDYRFICYSGCCENQCCGDWDDASIAGAVTGSLFGIVLLLIVITIVIRICCNTGRPRRHVYLHRTRHRRTRHIVITGSPDGLVNPVYTLPVQPPSYEQAVSIQNEAPPSYMETIHK